MGRNWTFQQRRVAQLGRSPRVSVLRDNIHVLEGLKDAHLFILTMSGIPGFAQVVILNSAFTFLQFTFYYFKNVMSWLFMISYL